MTSRADYESTSRALDATSDLAELLRLAHSAVHRAQAEVHGDAYDVATRLSRHLHYLRKVAALLRHEIERVEPASSAQMPSAAQSRSPRLPLRVRVLALRPQDG